MTKYFIEDVSMNGFLLATFQRNIWHESFIAV